MNQFVTPNNFNEIQEKMKEIITSYEEPITGVAISSPGAVNEKERRIDGINALPNLHEGAGYFFRFFFKGGLPYCLNFSVFRTVELATV